MWKKIILVLVMLLIPGFAWGQPNSPREMGREIESVLRDYLLLGNRPFETRWPSGSPKEKLERKPDGTISFTRFFPTGGYAVRYQRKPGTVIKLERYYGNGKTAILVNQDERIIDYTSYWENGNKKAKYQKNRQTNKVYYDARNKDGKQVYPVPRK